MAIPALEFGVSFEERMNNQTERDETGKVVAGTPEEIAALHRAWEIEHEAALQSLGIAMVKPPYSSAEWPAEQMDLPLEEEGLPPDLDDYDDL